MLQQFEWMNTMFKNIRDRLDGQANGIASLQYRQPRRSDSPFKESKHDSQEEDEGDETNSIPSQEVSSDEEDAVEGHIFVTRRALNTQAKEEENMSEKR